MDILQKNCVPCEGGIPPLTPTEVEKLLIQTPQWEVVNDKVSKITCTWKFRNFIEAMKFVNSTAELAEEEGHHPNIDISYSKVTLTLWTHAIDGLSENDFILAAKIDQLPEAQMSLKA